MSATRVTPSIVDVESLAVYIIYFLICVDSSPLLEEGPLANPAGAIRG